MPVALFTPLAGNRPSTSPARTRFRQLAKPGMLPATYCFDFLCSFPDYEVFMAMQPTLSASAELMTLLVRYDCGALPPGIAARVHRLRETLAREPSAREAVNLIEPTSDALARTEACATRPISHAG